MGKIADITSDKLMLSAEEVARVLSMSRASVWRLHSQGQLPLPLRLGRCTRWSREELENWIRAGLPNREAWEIMKQEEIE